MKNLTTNKEISFEELCALLKKGECIVLPTDTTYGLVCLTTVKNILENLNKTKANPQAKPPQILCTLDQAFKLADFDERAKKAAETFWPGALTLILKSTSVAQEFLPSETIGLRVPNNELILKIMHELDAPLFASSANIHGQGYTSDLEKITKIFAPKGICVVEGKSKNQASSIVDLTKKEIIFLREGEISIEEFKKVVSCAK